MSKTCFVIMPYGKKKDIDGQEIDFDKIYKFLIKKAVEKVPELECLRCDDIEQAGWIHKRMLNHICEDQVAIVDTSSLNANVFYELGVRHALKKSVTVLIHQQGTSWPFNIEGLSSIKYTTDLEGAAKATDDISNYIINGLKNLEAVDSLVYEAIPDLRVERGMAKAVKPKPITKFEEFVFPLLRCAGKQIALITGDREHIKLGDIWVNSENTEMQMDRFYGQSTSATIRHLGAKRHAVTGRVTEDTIGKALARALGQEKQVEPATVIPTGAGALQKNNNVKWIFHVAAVIGQPRQGYGPIKRIDLCVTNALSKASEPEFSQDGVKSILFPIFGTGPGGGDLKEHAELCIGAAVDYLESNPSCPIQTVYFYVWSDADLVTCLDVVKKQQGLKE